MSDLESVVGTLAIFEHLRPDEIGRIARKLAVVELAAGARHAVSGDIARHGESALADFLRQRLSALAVADVHSDRGAALMQARGPDLATVLRAADTLRREVNGDTVTYVVTRNINYTNVCYFRCGFCAFSKGKLAANLRGRPYLVPVDEIVRRTR